MKALDINTATWEDTAADRATWRNTLKQHLKTGKEKLMNATADKRAFRKERSTSDKPETTYKCELCGRDIGLYSHKRRCSNRATWGCTPWSTLTDGCLWWWWRARTKGTEHMNQYAVDYHSCKQKKEQCTQSLEIDMYWALLWLSQCIVCPILRLRGCLRSCIGRDAIFESVQQLLYRSTSRQFYVEFWAILYIAAYRSVSV